MENNQQIKSEPESPKTWKNHNVGLIVVITFYTIVWLVNIYPNHPKTITDWTIFISIATPLAIFLEWIGFKIFNAKIFTKISIVSLSATVGLLILAIIVGIVITKMLQQII